MQLNVTRSEAPHGWALISVEGEVDIASAPLLQDALDQAMADGEDRIAVDLQPVSFMDSTGLRWLITAQTKLTEAGGELVVIPGSGVVSRLLQIAGVEESFETVESVDELPQE